MVAPELGRSWESVGQNGAEHSRSGMRILGAILE